MKTFELCFLNTLLLAIGQILFKLGSQGKSMSSLDEIIRVLFSPTILIALFIYASNTILWLYILSKTDLSVAYPIQALAFPLVLVASLLIFNENISLNKWIGIGIIFIGIYVSYMKTGG